MQWSKLRTQVESLFADSVKGRVRLQTTGYRGMHDDEGRDWITVDDQELVNMPHWYPWRFQGYLDQPDQPEEVANYAALFAEGGLRAAMRQYLGMSINDILGSQNVLIHALGMLDRRVGKRTLRSLDVGKEHPLIRLFYRFRCDVEGLRHAACSTTVQEVDLRHPTLPWSPDKKKQGEDRREAAMRSGPARTLGKMGWRGKGVCGRIVRVICLHTKGILHADDRSAGCG